MSKKTGGADLSELLHWTRAGQVPSSWGAYESFESLVFTPQIQEHLQKLALGFLGARDFCAKAKLPWRRGLFMYGPAGVGKSAASRAISLALGWRHVTVPANEILDSHHLTRMFSEIGASSPSVVVLENLDHLLCRLDESVFLDAFDHASERLDGIFWIATTRRPELLPKTQLVRPGRFEESVRLAVPTLEVKQKYYENYLEPFMRAGLLPEEQDGFHSLKTEHIALLEANPDLTFAHLQEMRLLVAKVLMEGAPDRLVSEFQSFTREQTLTGDRSGGSSKVATDLAQRVRQTDPRLLISALHVTDAFKNIIEATVANASEALIASQEAGQS